MIRIDEIYYNLFAPALQGKKLRGIHWFDPFGSVKFQDLCSYPAVPWHDDATRFLFWDQEPLHKSLLDQTLPQFCDMYNGDLRLVVSEKDSEYVDYVCQTYGFKSHYYFFHGWAALDWYRGYNRSLLLKPAKDRNINKILISPNRIIGGVRLHRLICLYYLFKEGFDDQHISCPSVCPAESKEVFELIKSLQPKYPDIIDVFKKQTLPINFANEVDHPMHSYCLSLFNEAAESLLYLVTETVADGARLHLTEKIFKPIALQMPFMLVSTKGSLNYLRSYGFKTFDKLWSEEYDNEPDLDRRVQLIFQELKLLKKLSKKELQDKFEEAIPIIIHNYNHFYSGAFEEILWKEMKILISQLQT